MTTANGGWRKHPFKQREGNYNLMGRRQMGAWVWPVQKWCFK